VGWLPIWGCALVLFDLGGETYPQCTYGAFSVRIWATQLMILIVAFALASFGLCKANREDAATG
jgi:hypothetical protein